MQIFVKLFDGKIAMFESHVDTDRIIELKRSIREKLGNVNNPEYIYCWRILFGGKQLCDTDILIDVIPPDSTVNLTARLLGGPYTEKTEKLTINTKLPDYKDFPQQTMKCSPNQRISTILEYMVEALYLKDKHWYTVDDFELLYEGEILHPGKYLAEYSSLSRSFVRYNVTDKVLNQKTLQGFLISKYGDHYQQVLIGDPVGVVPQLVLERRSTIYPELVFGCIMCKGDGVIMPCCRRKLCDNCFATSNDFTCCTICGEKYE